MKDKGFTLVELLATMVILALLILIGTMTVSNIFDNSKDNYYKSLENTLSIAGNEYFNDNREDKPIDDYNFVDMETLINHEYMEELKTFDGKETCKSETGVFIYNDSNTTKYEVCLVCGDYKSHGDFCDGKKMGTISITGNINDPSGPVYNPLLSYSGTKWINAGKVYIHFNLADEGVHVSNYKIYNSNNSFVGDCAANSNNYCRKEFQSSGSYYVEAYDGSSKVANRKYFNIKIDNVPPTMDLKNLETNFLLPDDKIVIDYENEVINIHDDNGYKEVKYTLTRSTPTGPEYIARDKDLKESDLKIKEPLQSGKYDLYITVTDFAGNVATQSHTHIEFYIKYKVDLQYFDRNDNKHDVGNIKVYTYGKYTDLPGKVNLNSNPQEVSWYTNANMIGTATTSTTTVSKTTYHVLYGKEDKLKVSFGATCNNLTYNSVNQQLTTIPKDEQGKYRILVYYGGQIISNEAKDAKTYTVVAMLNPGYTWADGSTKAKAKQCTIKPYPVEFNPNTNPCNSNLIYNGSIQYLVTTKSCGAMATPAGTISTTYGKLGCIGENWGTQEYGATYGSVYGKDAGNYPVTYHLTSSNYVWADGSSGDKTYTCKIKPYRVEFNPNTNPCKPNLVYNGNAQELTTTSSCGGVSNSIAVGGGAGTGSIGCISGSIYGSEAGATFNPMRGNNAGSYPVTYHLKNSNFVWADGSSGDKTYTCKISPKKVSYPSDPCKKNLIYNSEKQYLLTIGDSGGPGAVLIMGTIWHNESSGYSDGYVQVGSKGYDYYIDGEYTGTNAQEYPVQFVLNNDENVNYTWSDGSTANKIYICKIDRYKIDTPTTGKCNKNLVYNGKDQLLTTDATSTTTTISILDDKGAYTISNRTRKDAGSQTVSYDIYNSQNYEWEDGSQSTKDISCSIAPKEISVTWGSTSTHAYDGKEWGRSASASTGISGETMTLTVTKKKKVGTYNTTATCSKVTNSKCSNYSLTNTTSTFSITDTTAPTCSVSVSSGTISMSGSDNYGLAYISAQGKGITTGSTYKSTGSACDSGTASSSLSFSSTITNMDRSSVTITGTVRDCAGNQNTCTTTVTRVIQKRTATCSSGKGCKEAGCQTRNYCRDKSCGCDTFNDWGSYSACNIPSYAAVSNDYTQCSKCNNGFYQCHTRTCNTYKSCQNSNCSCATYYTDIGKCGCASWGDYSGWQTVDSCSSGESGDHSTYTDCQTIFK